MPRIVYCPDYCVDIGTHVFPTIKYRKTHDRLLAAGGLSEKDFICPPPAADSDVLVVHTKEYIQKLKTGALTPDEIFTLELPYSKELVWASWLCAGGTILACKLALQDKVGIHLGGGFHHAFADHGEGFCVLNDVAIGIRRLQKDHDIGKALIIDCDLHQGNGTASIFADDHNVFTFSIHQRDNYPFPKPPSDLDINLEDGTGDEEYLGHLADNIPSIIADFKPELILYVAGSDPYEGDVLGGLRLSMDGLKRRDEFVLKVAWRSGIPVAVVLAGGYAVSIEDTVNIHYNTIKTALQATG